MKKVYEKPNIYIEKFELSQHIASCVLNVREWGTIMECYAAYSESEKYGNLKLFIDGNNNCEQSAESFCTYNMADATFNSY